VLTNRVLSELFRRAADDETGHRRQALMRATRSAYSWPEEAAELVQASRSLTELPSVGPWLAGVVLGWLEDPPELFDPDPSGIREDFLTLAEARSTLAEYPEWRSTLQADLQMHTTYSDGKSDLRTMVGAAITRGYHHVLITDHSKDLPIANGMDEERLAEQGRDIDALNEELASAGEGLVVLKGIEMNLTPEGEGDMEPAALARLDLVLGAFHSKLRLKEDQTERYVAALANRTVHVLAHPRGRMFNFRLGLTADWPRVFAAAERTGTALEIDAFPVRQDLNVELLRVARDFDVVFSIGTDAHRPSELDTMEFGLAAAIRAGIDRDRILDFWPIDRLRAWAARGTH
jgi:histidinol phosphatase-like PHP family hydrolase